MLSNRTALAAAASLAGVAAFLIHISTKDDGLGFSKVFVYGAYALALYRKKPYFLKLYHEESSLDEVVEQILTYFGFVAAAHFQFLVFAFALKKVDSNKNDPAVLVFYMNLLLGAAFAVRSAFGILVRGGTRIPWRHEIMGNDDPVSRYVRNTKKSPRRGHGGIPQHAAPPF